jgi:hypothetical protein
MRRPERREPGAAALPARLLRGAPALRATPPFKPRRAVVQPGPYFSRSRRRSRSRPHGGEHTTALRGRTDSPRRLLLRAASSREQPHSEHRQVRGSSRDRTSSPLTAAGSCPTAVQWRLSD